MIERSASRRRVLKAASAVGLMALWPKWAHAVEWRESAGRYLRGLARSDGGFAWPGQDRSHLTPTFAAVGCFRLLGHDVPDKPRVAAFVRTHHPAQLKKLEQEHHEFEWQQIQALLWLGEDVSSFRERVAAWRTPTVYLKQYEQAGTPILRHESAAFVCRQLLSMPMEGLSPAYVTYLESRRRANGSFNNTPADDGADGHVLNTWWGLQATTAIRRAAEMREETIAWLRACQLPGGGFTHQPRPSFAGVDDAAYTWAAVRALKLLGAAPAEPEACAKYLHSLRNANGGFADRPGWSSNPVAMYYALDALHALGALEDAVPAPAVMPKREALPDSLRVFSIQLEAHGRGSPAEAVDLAGALRIHLWGAKNAMPAWLARAQAIADQTKVPVRFFVSDEEYGTWMRIPGIGTYSHMSDIIAPAGAAIGESLASKGVPTWEVFRERRLAPLVHAGGRLVWQFGENEELVRLLLDDSVERGGYAAISTFHFGNPDFTNSEPFLHRWRGKVPFVALQDAHGAEPWWFADMTTGFRTLFLATEPTWEGWLEALKQNRVVAVRHDAVSGGQTWMHAGSSAVADFVKEREMDWRWWDNPAIARPMASIVAVRPEDEFEAGRPERGVAIRVRCAWENTAQGLAKTPRAELVRLLVDEQEVKAETVVMKQPRGPALADHYHRYILTNPATGRHRAMAVVREIATRKEHERAVEFLAG